MGGTHVNLRAGPHTDMAPAGVVVVYLIPTACVRATTSDWITTQRVRMAVYFNSISRFQKPLS